MQISLILVLLVILHTGKQVTLLNIYTGYFLWDIYANTEQALQLLGNTWSINGVPNNSKTYLCGTTSLYYIFGAYYPGDIVSKTFGPFPSHGVVTYRLLLIALDKTAWTAENVIDFEFEGQIRLSFKPYDTMPYITTSTTSTCQGIEGASITIAGKFFHSGETVTTRIISRAASNNPFFGLKHFLMIVANRRSIDVEVSCVKNGPLTADCPCGLNQYYDATLGSCQNCNTLCYQCFGPTASDCYSCNGPRSYDPISQACIPCSTNCFLCTGPQTNQCVTCSSTSILYWDNTCKADCPSPYITVGTEYRLCQTPCQPNGYMLIDKSCVDLCLPPLVLRVEGDAKFCDSPCTNPVSPYLYWNGSCDASCPYYTRTEHGSSFCDACQPGYFMYPNTTCLANCPSPYKQRTQGGSSFCDYPCDQSSPFYYDKQPNCRITCDYPYQIKDTAFCVIPLSTEQVAAVAAVANTVSSTSSATNTVGSSVSLISFSNPAAIFMETFADMFKYMKYMKIKFPPKLEYANNLKVDPPFTMTPDPPESLVNQIQRHTLPEKFDEDDDLHSSFLLNFWQQFVTLSVIAIIILVTNAAKKLPKHYTRIHKFCDQVNNILLWNFTLSQFTGSFGDIVLFTSFEARTSNPKDFLQAFSFFLCFSINLMAFLAIIKIVVVVQQQWKYIQHTNQDPKSQAIKDNLAHIDLTRYESVFDSYKTDSIIQQYFTCVFLVRLYIFVIVIAYLFEHPLFQSILIVVLNTGMLFYLLAKRPLKSKVDFAQYLLQELVMLIANLSLLSLAILDAKGMDSQSLRESLGDVIMNCNIAFSAVSCAYLGVQLFYFLQNGYKAIMSYHKRRQGSSPNQNDSSGLRPDTSSHNIVQTSSIIEHNNKSGVDDLDNWQPNASSNHFVGTSTEQINQHTSSQHLNNFSIEDHPIQNVTNLTSNVEDSHGNDWRKKIRRYNLTHRLTTTLNEHVEQTNLQPGLFTRGTISVRRDSKGNLLL